MSGNGSAWPKLAGLFIIESFGIPFLHAGFQCPSPWPPVRCFWVHTCRPTGARSNLAQSVDHRLWLRSRPMTGFRFQALLCLECRRSALLVALHCLPIVCFRFTVVGHHCPWWRHLSYYHAPLGLMVRHEASCPSWFSERLLSATALSAGQCRFACAVCLSLNESELG